MTQTFTLSAFARSMDSWPKQRAFSLAEILALLTTPLEDDGREKEAFPMWSPASYPPGVRRGKYTVEEISCLTADVDDGTPIAAALARLRKATPALAIVHTSYSHTPEKPKYRIVLPLATPISARTFPRAWYWLADVLECMDSVVHDVCRCYFVPVARPGFVAFVSEGPLLEAPEGGWETLPDPSLREPLRAPPGWVATPDRPEWSPRATDYPAETVALAVDVWRRRLADEVAAVAEVVEGRRTAILISAFALARHTWLSPDLATELADAFAESARVNGRLDDNILTLLEDCVNDAADSPAPIENLVPAAPGVAPPIVVKYRNGYWIQRLDGGYDGPVDARGMLPHLRERGDISLVSSKGSIRPSDKLVHDYGTNASTVEIVYPRPDGTVPRVWDAASRTLRTTRARRDTVVPRRVPAVEKWLAALFGTGHLAERALDWLATIDLLESPTAALYLEGPHGTGKSMIASALASPWRTSPVALDVAIGEWPIPMATCPIIWLDEGTNLDAKGTSRWRTLISERNHPLNEKHLPQILLHGCIRNVITANNADALGVREIRSLADLDAIVERVLHVPVREAARDYLLSLGARGTSGWVTLDDAPGGPPGHIAAHIAWLATARRVTPGVRWVVPGVRTEWHDSLLWRVPEYAAILGGILVGLDRRPTATFARVEGARDVLVDARVLHGQWTGLVLEDARRPTMQSLLRALGALSRGPAVSGVWTVDGRAVDAYAAVLGS